MIVNCPYCSAPARLTDGAEMYPHRPDLSDKKFYKCDPCGAYVGCHRGTVTPLGTLANAETRQARGRAHAVFDPIWKGGHMKRHKAYAWLSEQLGIEKDKCHIAMFDVDTCRRVVSAVKSRA